MHRHAAFRRDFHSFPYLVWIHPRTDVISSAVFIGSTAGRQKRKSGEIKASGTEKAVVVGESKEIVGSLPEFANKTILCRESGSHARASSLRAHVRKMRAYLSTIGFCGVKIFYFNLDNSGIYATSEPVATADYRSLPRFSCFHTHAGRAHHAHACARVPWRTDRRQAEEGGERTVYIHGRHTRTKSRVILTAKPLHLSLSSSSRNPFSRIPRYTISIRFFNISKCNSIKIFIFSEYTLHINVYHGYSNVYFERYNSVITLWDRQYKF